MLLMKRHIKIIAVFVVILLTVVACKTPCGCGGYGYLEINNAGNQVEQRA